MLVCDYIVKQIDGEYAHLQNVDNPMMINWWQGHCCRTTLRRNKTALMKCCNMK